MVEMQTQQKQKNKQKHKLKEPVKKIGFFAKPITGTVFTVLSGLSFLFLLMTLPLVGQAATPVPYRMANFFTFLAVLLFSLALAVLAIISKMARRKEDGSPMPIASFGLLGICVLLLLALFTGLLKV